MFTCRLCPYLALDVNYERSLYELYRIAEGYPSWYRGGITEWLPISSTGHMILVDEFIKLNVSDAFMEFFLVVIQLGAIMAVVVLYWSKLWPFYIRKSRKNTDGTA